MEKSIEYLHGNKYPKAMKIAKKFVGKSALRPVLLFTHHRKDGAITATDSHKAIIINDIHGFNENYLVHPNTGEFGKGDYPDVEKQLHTDGYETAIKLNEDNLKVWLQIHKSINQLTKSIYGSNTPVKLSFSDELKLKIDDKNGNELSIDLPHKRFNKQNHSINYRPELMRDALEAHVVMGSKNVSIKMRGEVRAIHLDNGKDVRTVVMPTRIF